MAVNYKFEWDPIKARENRDKHGVDFELAEVSSFVEKIASKKGIGRSSVVNDLLRGDIKIAEAME